MILSFKPIPEPTNLVNDVLPRFIQSLQSAMTDSDFKKVWQQLLEELFNPVTTQYLPENNKEKVIFSDEGLILHVPDVIAKGCYELSSKHQGNGLFNTQDVRTVESLFVLARAILHASRVREEATLTERTRIIRDLHDSLGAKLLSIVQRYKGHESADDARDALQTLRDTVHLSTSTKPLKLTTKLGQWRMETQERVEITNARLHWRAEGIEDDLRISAAQVLLLLSFLRETVSNALKHAQPENVFVRFDCSFGKMNLSVSNDGLITEPEEWKHGFGLSIKRQLTCPVHVN